ncbi:hypothetical protein FACS1894164_12230 [Spirochaetia bacterium]|nr:hypothetical protein FACS1894164_12230 [Spirochaetia bacterium]
MGKIKVVDSIEPSRELDPLHAEEREDFFVKLVMGKDVTTSIETSRGTFEVKYPKEKDTLAIGRLMSFRRNNYPIESFDSAFETVNMLTSTLDVIVTDGPPWYKRAKQSVSNWDWTLVPDRKFLREVYDKASEFRNTVETSFETGQTRGDSPIPATPGLDAAVDRGAFGDLSS